MTAEFIDLKGTMTAAEAIRRIRRLGGDCESIYTCYVTDGRRVLDGVVTLRELLLAPDNAPVRTLMEPNVITVRTTDDQELAVRALMRYDFLSLPVVDQEDRLVGVVTVDDVMDVMEEEATEDFQRMAAMAPSEKSYLKTGVFALAKNRILWLLVLMISGMITGGILGRYEAAFSVMPLLVPFIPMLTDTGGNAGSQSSTLVIRGMAVGEIQLKDFAKVFWKELRVSMLVGVVLSAVNFVRLIITYPGNQMVALTVALALFVTVLLAKTVGGVLPMVAKLCHADPAIMAAPLITTIVDAISLVVYFRIACALFSMYGPLSDQAAGTHRPELPGHCDAQVIVVVQIGLFLLTLEALTLLKLFPGRTALVAAVLVVGAGILTGQHKHDSSQLVFRRDTGSLKKQRQTLGWTPTWASSPRSAARRGEEERAGAGRP